jgi:hypothetical protein
MQSWISHQRFPPDTNPAFNRENLENPTNPDLTLHPVNFEEFLLSKKIDGLAFSKAEPGLFNSWKQEFEQMHPNSFTVQKLNLINPIRRKYQLKEIPVQAPAKSAVDSDASATPAVKPGKPIIKPRPKIN